MTSTGSSSAPRKWQWLREGAVVAAAFVVCSIGGLLHTDDTLAPPLPQTYLLAAVSSALLAARHRAPLITMAGTTLCGMLVAPMGLLLTPLIVAPTVISAYSLAVRAGRWPAAAVLLASATLLLASPSFFEPDFSWEDTSRLVTVAVSLFAAAVLGRSARHRRAYLALVEDRARRAEESRDSEARRKVSAERSRIARELHDLVAHQITLANAQASVAAHLFDTRPEQARTNVKELVKTTRNALDDLRATVGLLREAEDVSQSTEPVPGLSQVPTLLVALRRAGLEVSFQEEGTVRPLPPATDLAAYRVIQESLTNVTKHAGTANAEVRLSWNRSSVAITVTDDGVSLSPKDRLPGYGLIGMRERVVAAGGAITAGPRIEGGFIVRADLPYPKVDTERADGNPNIDEETDELRPAD